MPMISSLCGRAALAGLVLAGTAASLQAQSAPKITSLSARWAQRGAPLDLAIAGENLAEAKAIVISGEPGLAAELIPSPSATITVESGGGISSVVPKDSKNLSARLTIKADAALGAREIRVLTPSGISNPLPIDVGYLPEASEKIPNQSTNSATEISVPAAINGVIGSGTETDYFKFTAQAGQQFVFEVFAARMGSPLDSTLAVLDQTGKELARSEDALGLDSLLEFKAPTEGLYFLQIRDFEFRGDGNYRYRIFATSAPYVRSVFPMGAQRGQTVEVEAKGWNLGGASKVLLNIASDSATGRQDIRLQTPQGASNPFGFKVGTLPEFRESEPNSAIDQADAVSVPGVINGKIQGEDDYDAFKFRAEKDQTFILEAEAARLGSPLDTLLTLTDASGNVLQRNDDAAGADARIEHRFAESGDYVLLVEDLVGRNGDDFAYRIEIREPKQDFSVRMLPDTPRIHRGGTTPIRCELTRVRGFDKPVRITAADLPPGIFADSLVFSTSDPASGILLLRARSDAAVGTFPIKLIATADLNGAPAQRGVQPLSGDAPAKEAFLTILDAPPFTLELLSLNAAAEQEQTAQVRVLAVRQPGFQGEIKLSAEGFSAGREPITRSVDHQPVTLKAGESEATLSLRARLDSEVGTRMIVVKGETATAAGPAFEFSKALPLTITQTPFVLSTTLKRLTVTALPSSSDSAAREAVFAVKAGRRMGFNGEIALSIEGLPEGTTVEAGKIPEGGGEASIRIVASEKAPVGKEFSIKILGTGVFNDRTWRQRPEEIKLVINAPEKQEVQTAEIKQP